MRITVRLAPEVVQALDTLAAGRSQSDAVRDAILLAARLSPILARLDRIEAALASGVVLETGSQPEGSRNQDDAARQVIATLGAWGADDDE